jgi:hypothetical protein
VSSKPRAIPGTDLGVGLGPINPVFSPDGQSIAFHDPADGTLKRISVNGGAAITIGPIGTTSPAGMSWSAEEIVVGGQSGGGIARFSPSGGMPEQIVKVDAGEYAHGPQMLPAGTRSCSRSTSAPIRVLRPTRTWSCSP